MGAGRCVSVDGLDVDGAREESTVRDDWELHNTYEKSKRTNLRRR